MVHRLIHGIDMAGVFCWAGDPWYSQEPDHTSFSGIRVCVFRYFGWLVVLGLTAL